MGERGDCMIHYLRQLPVIQEFTKDTRFYEIMGRYNLTEATLCTFIEDELAMRRKQILEGTCTISSPSKHTFLDEIFTHIEKVAVGESKYSLQRVINGTGVVLHTSFGRSRLSEEAVRHMVEIAVNYTNIEYDTAHRTERTRNVIAEKVIQQVTGAEAAMVVNNNAAAMYIILKAFAASKEVLVSRGHLVEMEGSFRISSVIEDSGAILREVGAMNRTYIEDYKQAINDQTALLMSIHTSSVKTIGFTATLERQEVITLCSQTETIYYEDVGSGALFDYRMYGIGNEPIVKEVIELGADLVSFSGDKLLGGPQVGIIAGKKQYIDQLKNHPLVRILRVDKITLAALEATLLAYTKGTEEMMQIPTVRAILEEKEVIKDRADRFVYTLIGESSMYDVEVQESISSVGGGTMPGVEIPTYVAVVSHEWKSSQEIDEFLRSREPSIVARVEHNQLILDFRTITEDEINLLVDCFLEIEET
jgi:L-seryl-tRNA(Ser) seleniumtransferase